MCVRFEEKGETWEERWRIILVLGGGFILLMCVGV